MSTPIYLSNLQCYIAAYNAGTIPSTNAGWFAMGDQKSAAEISYEEKYAEVKTIESGNEAVKAVIDSQTVMGKITISDLTLAKLDMWKPTELSNFDGMTPDETAATTTSGSLVSGKRYTITTFVAGDDFAKCSNVDSVIISGRMNTTGCIFEAAGTAPTTWTNSSSITLTPKVLSVTNAIGRNVTEYIIRLHPVEELTSTALDLIITRAVINKKFEKKGTAGDQASVILDFKGLWDANSKKTIVGITLT